MGIAKAAAYVTLDCSLVFFFGALPDFHSTYLCLLLISLVYIECMPNKVLETESYCY